MGVVAGAGSMAGERGVDPDDTFLDCNNGVRDRQGQVLVGVDADFGFRVAGRPGRRGSALADAVHVRPPPESVT